MGNVFGLLLRRLEEENSHNKVMVPQGVWEGRDGRFEALWGLLGQDRAQELHPH